MDAVRNGEVEQTRRWYFVSRRLLFWLSILSSIVVGIIAFSAMINTINLSGTALNSLVLLAPVQFFWLIIMIIATVIGWRLAKTSVEFYRWRHSTIILTSILISIVGGYVLSLTTMNNHITQAMYKRSAYYQALYVQLLTETANSEPSAFEILLERERIRTLCFKDSEMTCYTEGSETENTKSDINPE